MNRAQTENDLSSLRPTSKTTKPKSPLHAYNLFFMLERKRIIEQQDTKGGASGESGPAGFTVADLQEICEEHRRDKPKRKHRKTHGRITFRELSRTIASRWKRLDMATRQLLEDHAALEKSRHDKQLAAWKATQPHEDASEKKPAVVVVHPVAPTLQPDPVERRILAGLSALRHGQQPSDQGSAAKKANVLQDLLTLVESELSNLAAEPEALDPPPMRRCGVPTATKHPVAPKADLTHLDAVPQVPYMDLSSELEQLFVAEDDHFGGCQEPRPFRFDDFVDRDTAADQHNDEVVVDDMGGLLQRIDSCSSIITTMGPAFCPHPQAPIPNGDFCERPIDPSELGDLFF